METVNIAVLWVSLYKFLKTHLFFFEIVPNALFFMVSFFIYSFSIRKITRFVKIDLLVTRQKRPKYAVKSAPIKDYRGFADSFSTTNITSSVQLNNYQYFISNQCIDIVIHQPINIVSSEMPKLI